MNFERPVTPIFDEFLEAEGVDRSTLIAEIYNLRQKVSTLDMECSQLKKALTPSEAYLELKVEVKYK